MTKKAPLQPVEQDIIHWRNKGGFEFTKSMVVDMYDTAHGDILVLQDMDSTTRVRVLRKEIFIVKIEKAQ